jgi:hypothetical protein
MIKLNYTLILIFTFLFSLTVPAATPGLSIEPLYGIERSQRLFPAPAKTITKTFLGVRGVYGTKLISGELEVSQASNNEEFSATDTKVEYTTQRAMLGVRTYPFTSQYLGLFFRAGARAQMIKRKVTTPTETSNEDSPLTFDPYAGAGVTLAFSNNFALSAGATLVYNRDAPSSEQYDTQYNLSFTIRAGQTR